MSTIHVVQAGENLSLIAEQYGFRAWRTIYDAPENASFRERRPNPHLIQVGDEVVIPDRETKQVPVSPGASHRIQLAAKEPLPAEIAFQFVDGRDQTQVLPGLEVDLAIATGPLPLRITDAAGGIYLAEPEIEEGVVRVTDIRDLTSSPPRSWPGNAGDFNTGHFHVVALPADPIAAALPIPLVRSTRRPLLNEDATPARDMLFGDYTQQQIEDIGVMFQLDDAGYNLATVAPSVLFAQFRRMATELFSTGALEDNINRMIDSFEANTGAEYSSGDLDTAVRSHASTGRFEQDIRGKLRRLINLHNGEVNRIRLNQMTLAGRPRYNTTADILGGLTIAINDTHAHDVDLIEYAQQGTQYTGKFRLTLTISA